MNELEMIADKVNVNEFSIDGFDLELSKKIDEKIAYKKKDYQWFLLNLQNTEKDISERIPRFLFVIGAIKEHINNPIVPVNRKADITNAIFANPLWENV